MSTPGTDEVLSLLHAKVAAVTERQGHLETIQKESNSHSEHLEQLKASHSDLTALEEEQAKSITLAQEVSKGKAELQHLLKDLKSYLHQHEGEVKGTPDWEAAHRLVDGSETLLESVTHYLARLFGME